MRMDGSIRPGRPAILALALVALVAVPASAAAVTFNLLPHRAVYDLDLGSVSNGAGISGFKGRILYEFEGSECEGYTTTYRNVGSLSGRAGFSRLTDHQSTSFEAADHSRFDFANKVFVDHKPTEETMGSAERGDGIALTLTKPKSKTLSLDTKIMFPTQHMLRVLQGAIAGERFLQADVYDGAQTGEQVYSTSTVIGPQKNADDGIEDEPAAKAAEFAGARLWPITIGYFEQGKGEGEVLPEYEMSLLLYENGVTRRLRIDYGDFVIRGRLVQIEFLKRAACE